LISRSVGRFLEPLRVKEALAQEGIGSREVQPSGFAEAGMAGLARSGFTALRFVPPIGALCWCQKTAGLTLIVRSRLETSFFVAKCGPSGSVNFISLSIPLNLNELRL
jgi:hypothetical protein